MFILIAIVLIMFIFGTICSGPLGTWTKFTKQNNTINQARQYTEIKSV